MFGKPEKHTCKVCKGKFDLLAANRYTAAENKGSILTAFTSAEQYDAFDCPFCGCQNIVGVRNKLMEIREPEVIDVEESEEEDGEE